ncbi:PIR Superfamily Protein [Plasmodium ovale curtisi]|uniref:PIR Superfamily Protein n=1 Tax=Plasmodium ovale curtisi TaxID=864141 RepID=A0A1A8WSS2_PLAOA|nr:PIR Superfamily Protein [Plasmodium ovale curtisi]
MEAAIKELPLNQFYEEFEKFSHNDSNYICRRIIGNTSKDEPKFIRLCEQLCSIVESFDKIKKKHNVDSDAACDYLGYWLYDKLTKISSDTSNINEVHATFYDVYNSKKSLGCKYDYYNKCSREEFEVTKQLYDYSENFISIQKNNEKNNIGYDQKKDYCSYIRKGLKYYEDIAHNYISKNKHYDYKKKLKDLKDNFYKIELTSLNCQPEIESTLFPKEHNYDEYYSVSYINAIDMTSFPDILLKIVLPLFGLFTLLLILNKYTSFGSYLYYPPLRKRRYRFRNADINPVYPPHIYHVNTPLMPYANPPLAPYVNTPLTPYANLSLTPYARPSFAHHNHPSLLDTYDYEEEYVDHVPYNMGYQPTRLYRYRNNVF